MNTSTLFTIRRRMTTLAIAALIALSAAYAPMLLDEVAGTSMTGTVNACSGANGGC